jgi:uncharacterized repeat protein (TIGR03837 family)
MESTRAIGPGALRWTVFCRVVDNFGDVGVCWRLAAQLGARGDRVRLVIDDASALAWMAPGGAAGVEVSGWHDAAFDLDDPDDVVVEAFGCDPPPAFVAAMRTAARVPVWINLEYLSAEAYVERSHGLSSPQLSGPGAGLTKWFFYPGFTARTGGLLREDGLLAARTAFDVRDRAAWLAAHGIDWRPGERVVTLFCYDNPACAELIAALGRAAPRTLLLLTPGPAQRQVTTAPPGVRLHAPPWLPQPAFDRLLWSSDLAFVRGEDSLVRALWAGVPFVWQAYPQHDGAHHAKVEALLARLAPPPEVAALWRAWNGIAPWPAGVAGAALGVDPLAPDAAWARSVQRLRDDVASRPDLAAALRTFALDHIT